VAGQAYNWPQDDNRPADNGEEDYGLGEETEQGIDLLPAPDSSLAAIANLLAGSSPRVKPPEDVFPAAEPRSSHAATQYESQAEPGAAWEARARPQPEPSQGPNQMAVRQAQLAASQAYKEVENLQCELAMIRDRLQRAEQSQLTKTLSYSRQVSLAEAQADGLRAELAAAVAINHALEARMPLGKAPLWIGVGALVSAAIVCAILLPRMHAPQAHASSADAPVASLAPGFTQRSVPENRPPKAYGTPAKFATSAPNGSMEQALNRLDKAMNGMSPQEAEGIFNEANKRLKASGYPPCATTVAGGKASLLLSSGTKDHQGPLAESLDRCAEAVEQVVR
jgi:hypothetical protein